jgi:predicted RNA binding protein YcfA (HicA-like mRNA interferase family)
MVEADGWYQVATKGSHRQFKHPVKIGRVSHRRSTLVTSLRLAGSLVSAPAPS